MKKPYSRDTDQSPEKQCLIYYVPSPGWTVDFLCLETFNYPPLFIRKAKILSGTQICPWAVSRRPSRLVVHLKLSMASSVTTRQLAVFWMQPGPSFLGAQAALPSSLQHHHPSIPQQNMWVIRITFADIATFKRIFQSFPCSSMYMPLLNLLWIPERGPLGPIFLPFNQPLSFF